MQHAQPVLLSHHLLAYSWMFARDFTRLKAAFDAADNCPLGAAALAGTSFPLDRQMTAAELGFAGVIPNSLDAVSDRDILLIEMFVDRQRRAKLLRDLGQWYSPLKNALDAFMADTQKFVTGTVRLKFFKGNCHVVGRKSPFSLYDYGLATYDRDTTFDEKASAGFIEIDTLSLKTWAKVGTPCARYVSRGWAARIPREGGARPGQQQSWGPGPLPTS